jgi:hypothetical protein
MNPTSEILSLIAEHRKVADAATEGPWREHLQTILARDGRRVPRTKDDATFIAHSRNTMPALLDALEDFVKDVDEVSEVVTPQLRVHLEDALNRVRLALLNGEKQP